jgi:hypothetical protein
MTGTTVVQHLYQPYAYDPATLIECWCSFGRDHDVNTCKPPEPSNHAEILAATTGLDVSLIQRILMENDALTYLIEQNIHQLNTEGARP